MPLEIRRFQSKDAKTFLEVHHRAVRGSAATDYPTSVIDAWAPAIGDCQVEHLRNDGEGMRILAEDDNEVIGIGEVVPELGELRACYVAPEHSGKGVGRTLVEALEHIARSNGCWSLSLDSSLNAAGFYEKLGYAILARGEHMLGPGQALACIRMRKEL